MKGLSSEKAREIQKIYGKNEITAKQKQRVLEQIKNILSQPMFALLLAASSIYFLLRKWQDGIIMLLFVFFVIGIHILQERKTKRSLDALRQLSEPKVTVYRDGEEKLMPSSELVPGDWILLVEGNRVPADGKIVESSDLCMDESMLTGESQGVYKGEFSEWQSEAKTHISSSRCYAGTLVTRGSAVIEVERIGDETLCGRIGKQIAGAKKSKSPLSLQMGKLVKICTIIAAGLFLSVFFITFFSLNGEMLKIRLSQSLLSGVTLAMAMIPEEFPVILTVFFCLGAHRLVKKKSLVRNLCSVEMLGEISTLCVDKTGTITQNQMKVVKGIPAKSSKQAAEKFLISLGLACENPTYDPMENAILQHCALHAAALPERELLYEYPFTNEKKRIGHLWQTKDGKILAVKGAPDSVLKLCSISQHEKERIIKNINQMSRKGLRVLAVASLEGEIEVGLELDSYTLNFRGIIGLEDPPRPGIAKDIDNCLKAGIQVVMVTGDSEKTASAIAKKVGIPRFQQTLTGEQMDEMSDDELAAKASICGVFARVMPEHKTRIIKALKRSGRVVAMTGDGVNDAAALKYADIGIAMGKRGSDVAREAADIVLLDDNFSTIVDTIKDGRRIYDNIQKAIGYVLAIHIPIALISLLCPFLGIASEGAMLLPAIIMLLEMVIDPTCSIVLERQAAEQNIMERPPRSAEEPILSKWIILKSLLQGFVIFAASFNIYLLELATGRAETARTLGVIVLLLAYLMLAIVNSSNAGSSLVSGIKLVKDRVVYITGGIIIFGMILVVYSPLHHLFHLASISLFDWLRCLLVAFLSVVWYEGVKWLKRSL